MAELRQVCPFCGTRFDRPLDEAVGTWHGHAGWESNRHGGPTTDVGRRGEHGYRIFAYTCMKCSETSVDLHHTTRTLKDTRSAELRDKGKTEVVPLRPWGTERPAPAEVPAGIADDYHEATRIMGLSLKGATTMARRCLQRMIREAHPTMPAKAKERLVWEIDWVIANASWEQDVKDTLHHLRWAGNFGAHPGDDGITEVYELNEDDLEACLALLEHLFQRVYVEPARTRERLQGLRARVPLGTKAAKAALASAASTPPPSPPAQTTS